MVVAVSKSENLDEYLDFSLKGSSKALSFY